MTQVIKGKAFYYAMIQQCSEVIFKFRILSLDQQKYVAQEKGI